MLIKGVPWWIRKYCFCMLILCLHRKDILHDIWYELSLCLCLFTIVIRQDSCCLLKRNNDNKRGAIKTIGVCLNIKNVFPWIKISIIKIGRRWGPLIFIMGIVILQRRHLYIKTVPASLLWPCAIVGACFKHVISRHDIPSLVYMLLKHSCRSV